MKPVHEYDISVRELATMAKVATDTISRLEAGKHLKPRTIEAIQHALEKAGIEFSNHPTAR